MKKILLSACVTMVIAFANNPVLASAGSDDLIKMARSGVDEEVLTAYVDGSPDTFDLSAEDIITLKDLGVPSKVISEALRHGHANEADSIAATEAKETIKAATNEAVPAAPAAQAVVTSSAVAPPPGDCNVSFFYESLYPYGNWLEIDGQWCWQPSATVMSPDWAPYCRHGHWVNSDWGWCWVSDYSWGWAPFHYGRWFHHRTHGWCWVPGTEWGPAWVSWRRGEDYCGWAPLPPSARYVNGEGFYFGAARAVDNCEFNLTVGDFCFLSIGHFCDPHPWVNLVPSVRVEEAYRKTTVIRNSYGFEHNHVYNHGPAFEEVSRASNRRLESITIVHDDIKPGEPIHRGLQKGNQLLIYKPEISAAVPRNPAAVKVLLEKRAQVDVQRKESTGDADVVKRRNTATQQTLKNQQLRADNAEKEKFHLEQAATYESDSKKRASYQSEAEIQSMNHQQAQNHVVNIQQWKPPVETSSAVMPRSRIVPQPSAENREQVRNQVRTQVQNEAQVERQRQPAAEEMVRKSPAQPQAANNVPARTVQPPGENRARNQKNP